MHLCISMDAKLTHLHEFLSKEFGFVLLAVIIRSKLMILFPGGHGVFEQLEGIFQRFSLSLKLLLLSYFCIDTFLLHFVIQATYSNPETLVSVGSLHRVLHAALTSFLVAFSLN